MSLAPGALRDGYRLNWFETLGSTNDEAMRRAAAGDRGCLWIAADTQTAGRGRQGRSWSAPPGNLYASLLLVDVVEAAIAWQLGFVGGVALAEAVGSVLGAPRGIAIKWPNDLLADGAKLAGLLVEGTRLTDGRFAVVLGFGVNCASHPAGTPYPATHLDAVADRPVPVKALLAALSRSMAEALVRWDGGRGFGALRERWLQHALKPGTRLSVSAPGGRRAGVFETIDGRGRLVLLTPDGRETIDVGDIEVVEAPVAAG